MRLLDALRDLLGLDDGPPPYVELSCPETGRTIATEDSTPEWEDDEDHAIARYDCPDCPSTHRFLWGPPAPIRLYDVGDAEGPA